METSRVENKSLFQGNNEFETGIITIPASTVIPTGALLARSDNGKFKVINDTDTENPVAVNPVELKNNGNSPSDTPFRALVGGRVRFDMLSVDGKPITDKQSDLLRQFAGIVAKKVTDLSHGFWD